MCLTPENMIISEKEPQFHLWEMSGKGKSTERNRLVVARGWGTGLGVTTGGVGSPFV